MKLRKIYNNVLNLRKTGYYSDDFSGRGNIIPEAAVLKILKVFLYDFINMPIVSCKPNFQFIRAILNALWSLMSLLKFYHFKG